MDFKCKYKSCILMISFPYNPDFVQNIKTIEVRRWNPEGRYWSFQNSNGTIKKVIHVNNKAIGKIRSPLDSLNLKEGGVMNDKDC